MASPRKQLKRVNRTKKFTARACEEFLRHLAKTGNVTDAAEHIGLRREYMYQVRMHDTAFRAAWDNAIEIATDALEREARRRALAGWDEPVYYRGEQVGKMRLYSDRLLEILLKAHRPEKFKETVRQEHTGANGQPFAPLVTVYLPEKASMNGHHDHDPSIPVRHGDA